eukprot:353445-Chlamydomonas_euryale.AAC.34
MCVGSCGGGVGRGGHRPELLRLDVHIVLRPNKLSREQCLQVVGTVCVWGVVEVGWVGGVAVLSCCVLMCAASCVPTSCRASSASPDLLPQNVCLWCPQMHIQSVGPW